MAEYIRFKTQCISEDKSVMSLLDDAYEDFTVINKAVIDDGYGGTTTTWSDGAAIKGAMVFNTSTEMMVARVMGATSAYIFTVHKDIELDYHTVLRRESDGKIFRLTSNTDDKKTPPSATLNMRQYTAEDWKYE